MKVSLSHGSSPITCGAGRPPIFALKKSGYIVELWLPQMARFVTAATSTPAFRASWIRARFWSSIVIANQRSDGTDRAWLIAIRQLVLQGLPTTSTRTSGAAVRAMAWPWPVKIRPLMPRRSLRSMPALRGTEPTSRAQLTPVKPSSSDAVATIPWRSGNAQSSNSMTTPRSARRPGAISSRWRATGCSGPNIEPEAIRNRSE